MKTKPTFFNTRNERLFWNYTDTNNYLFTIIYKEEKQIKEKNYILRDLKQNKTLKKYIYKKLDFIFNIIEVDISRLSKYEYETLLNLKTPTLHNVFKIRQLSCEKLQKVKTNCRQDNKL